jgi:hypothetical protein
MTGGALGAEERESGRTARKIDEGAERQREESRRGDEDGKV